MPKESSRHGDTSTNTYIDPGATTPEAYEISKTSRTLARKMVGNKTPDDRVRQRCSVAVGDFAMAGLMRFNAGSRLCHDSGAQKRCPDHHRYTHGAGGYPEERARIGDPLCT